MKLNRTLFIMLSALLVLSFSGSAFAADITFACESKQDFPAVMGEGNAPLATNPGLAIEAAMQVCDKIGVTYKIKRMPWKRCLASLESGSVNSIFTASFKEKRLQYGKYPEKDGKVDPTRRFSDKSYSLYVLKGSDVSYDGSAFANVKKRIGAPAGYSIVDDLKKKGIKVDESPSTEQDLKKLILGRLDGVAALMMTGDYYLLINKEFGEKVVKISPPIIEKPYYFMFSHQFLAKNADLAEKFWDTLAEVREDPEFKKRLSGYLN